MMSARAMGVMGNILVFLAHWGGVVKSRKWTGKGKGRGKNPRRCCQRGPALRSVFRGKHDSQNPDGLFRVARVFAALGQRRVVIIDLPENPLAVVLKGSEVAFLVRVVVRGESIEGFHLLADSRLIFLR